MTTAAGERRPAMFAPRKGVRLPSGVMIYQGRHHTAAAYQELLAWLEYLRAEKKRPKTLADYERYIARLLIRYPDVKFAEFTDAHILPVLNDVPDQSRHIALAPFNQWFKWGRKTRRLIENPAEFLPNVRYRPNRNLAVFTESEVAALRGLVFPHGQLMTVLFETGIRLGEARCLTPKRVLFRSQELLIVDGAKGGKERIVPLTMAASGALDELIAVEGLNRDDHFWASHPGGGHRTKRDIPVVATTFYRWWKLCLEEAGVDYRKVHATRHSFATRWLETDGMDDAFVQDVLGHESISTTRDIYQHRNIGRIGDTMRRLEAEAQSSSPLVPEPDSAKSGL